MPKINRYINQTDEHKCAIAVIRIIRENSENVQFSDSDILKDFADDVALRGPNVDEISQYWRKYAELYEYEKGTNQVLEDMKKKKDEGYWVMIILNYIGSIFHCVLFKNADESCIDYWDPQLSHQTKSNAELSVLRRGSSENLLEVHYIRYVGT